MTQYILQKPFLKWVGGKTQIIDTILDKLPLQINNYHEPFVGGGSVLLAVLSLQQQKKITIKGKIYASDINRYLIEVYQHIQTDKDNLFKWITKYITEYGNLTGTTINRKARSLEEAKTSKESYYYWMRARFNELRESPPNLERSALFMVLNKTCFRGMYRESRNGYNVPYGHYKRTPTVITKDELDQISRLIQPVEFSWDHFGNSLKKVKAGDFVYFDPPYAPETAKSFVGYNLLGFNLATHHQLFGEIRRLHSMGVNFILSNAKVKLVTETFSDFKMIEITARRAINSKKPDSTTTEVLIYSVDQSEIK